MDQSDFFEMTFYDNTVARWTMALGLTLLVGVGLRLFASLLIRHLAQIARRTQTDLDDLLIQLLRKTKVLFVFIVAVWAGSLLLNLTPRVETWIRQILMVGLLLQAAPSADGTLFTPTQSGGDASQKQRRRQ